MKNILFYKYVEIKAPEQFRDNHLKLCKSLSLKGKVLVAKEGINGCVTGTTENIEKYKQTLKKDKRFSDIEFKQGLTENHNFNKLFVRVRREIVTSGMGNILESKAEYIEPKEFKQLLDSGKEVILIDARNNYESKIGKFKNAIAPNIDIFREFPEAMKKLENLKDKKIVTYCTGGIRCEKASAYLKEQGFRDVKQLHGGIIKYGKECGNDHWKGKCFVFDKRGAIEIDPSKQTEPITQCELCNLPKDKYYNCARIECDKRFISCKECLKVLENCCSKHCRNLLRTQKEITVTVT